MTQEKPPAISFRDLTLGYDRHPAVHHITGDVARGDLLALVGPNGAGKSTLLKGIVGQLKPLARLPQSRRAQAERHRLSAATDRHRPQLPDHGVRRVAMGLWRDIGAWRGLDRGRSRAVLEALAHARPARSRRANASARCRAGSSNACCSRGCSCKTRPSSCSTSRSAPSTPRRSRICYRADRRWHGEGRTVIAALHDVDQVRAHFPQTLLIAREVVAWGPTKQVLTRRATSPRRASSSRRGTSMPRFASAARQPASGCRHDPRPYRSLRRIRLHAPGAGRLPCALARRAAGRRISRASPLEPDGRRHEPRDPARRGNRLSSLAGLSLFRR